jgi:DNA-damage-inducible protein J
MDEELKKNMERTCKSMGLTMTSAFTMFATKMTKEQRIPFEIEADPFFSEENIQEIERRVANLNAGKSTLKEHEVIEVE